MISRPALTLVVPGKEWLRLGGAQLALTLAIVAIVAGAGGIAFSVEPDTYGIFPEPWLVPMPDGRIGALFIVSGKDQYAVMFGFVSDRGEWSMWPKEITPRYDVLLYPASAFARADGAGRIHVAWNLFDIRTRLQDFRYLRLDPSGTPVVSTGALGTSVLADDMYTTPGTPFPILDQDFVRIVWRAANESYIAATLSFDGVLLAPPAPISLVANESFLTRERPPGETEYERASTLTKAGGKIFYLFTKQLTTYAGRQVYVDTELRILIVDSTGSREASLYSTRDWWWTGKPFVLPSGVALGAGTAVLAALGRSRLRPHR